LVRFTSVFEISNTALIRCCTTVFVVSVIGETKINILLTLREEFSYGYEPQDKLGLNRGTIYVHLK